MGDSMRRGITALTLTAALLAAGAVFADDTPPTEEAKPAAESHASSGMAGNAQFLLGQAYLHDSWKPFDEPSTFGVRVDFAPAKSPVHVALGLNMAVQSKNISTPFYGQNGKVGVGFLEFSAGALWLPVKKAVVRPYLGLGIVRILAGAGSGSNWSNDENDNSFGFYGNAGIYFKVGDTFNIGFDGRLVRGTKITLAGVETDVDYGQASLLLGFSWGQ